MSALLVNAAGAQLGGAITYLRSVIPRLAAQDAYQRVVVLTDQPDLLEIAPGEPSLEIIAVPRLTPAHRILWHRRQVPRLVDRYRADVLLSLLNFGPSTRRVPQVVLQRNAWYFTRTADLPKKSRLMNMVRRRVALATCAASQMVVVPSRAMAGEVERWLRADHPPVEVVPHGIDYGFWSPSEDNLQWLPQEVPATGWPKLVYVSHASAHKGHQELLEAAHLLKDQLPDYRLVLTVSDGPGERQEDLSRVRQLQVLAGDDPRILFIGRRSRFEIRALYQWADLVVFPSKLESFGFPLLEAMAMGKAVLASGIPSLVELGGGVVRHHAAGDPESIRNEIYSLAQDRAACDAMGRAGRARAGGYDWDLYVPRLLEAVRKASGT